ncbi:MAG: diguanylate cyclase [Acidobacteriia bacterium]|nr:diguanylate cyclase [Terriglobia bacterium]
MKILVADDDMISRRMMESVLTAEGYEVLTAVDGEGAVALLCADGGPRLALLDWMMPGKDGPSVCREVRHTREQPYVYMVLLTTRDAKADVIAGLEAGADDYLTKPVYPAELRVRLRCGRRILQLEDRLIEAREEMRHKATHDALTSLLNRGFILELLQREVDRSRREPTSIALLLGDLDHFKKINDEHGHPVGDEVLRETARRLATVVRPYDAVGRYGGEEFLVVLAGCDAEQGQKRAEQIRAAIAGQPVATEGGPVPVTMSIGVVASSDWESADVERLLQEVDKALYQAKAAGRNAVVLGKPDRPRTPAKHPADSSVLWH